MLQKQKQTNYVIETKNNQVVEQKQKQTEHARKQIIVNRQGRTKLKYYCKEIQNNNKLIKSRK